MNWNSPVAEELAHRQIGIEAGFDLGGREQVVEARAGRLRGFRSA